MWQQAHIIWNVMDWLKRTLTWLCAHYLKRMQRTMTKAICSYRQSSLPIELVFTLAQNSLRFNCFMAGSQGCPMSVSAGSLSNIKG